MSMLTLSGKVVGLLESRQREALASMVVRLGGTPVCAPAMREVPLVGGVEPVIDQLIAGDFSVALALTGAAVSTLLGEAESRHRLDELRSALSRMVLVCRGPKPQTMLRRHGLQATFMTTKPHTTDDLLEVLAGVPLDGQSVLLLQYGERNTTVSGAVVQAGARVTDACLYEWALPEDLEPVTQIIERLLAGELDALVFTTQVQFRHLLIVAERMGVAPALIDVLSRDVVVGAIGPVCARALRAGGVIPDVMPGSPNSASLIASVGDYFHLASPADL